MSETKTVRPFQLLQWKHAIRLELKGIKHSRGSVSAHAGRALGMKPRSRRADVLALVTTVLDQCKANGVPMLASVEIEFE